MNPTDIEVAWKYTPVEESAALVAAWGLATGSAFDALVARRRVFGILAEDDEEATSD